MEECEKILRDVAQTNGALLPRGKLVNENGSTEERGVLCYIWLPAYKYTSNLLLAAFFSCVLTYYGICILSDEIFKGEHLYYDMFISTLSEVPGLFFGWLMLDRIGRKKTMYIFYAVFTVACCLLVWKPILENESLAVFLVFTARMAISTSFYVIYIYYSEFYPTIIRNVALGLASSVGRIAG